jgi:hypothetical protein
MDEALKEYYGFNKAKRKSKTTKKVPSIVKAIKEYKLQEIDKTKTKSISYSQYSTFNSCKHKWSLQYKDGFYTNQVSIHMTFGTALHETLQHYLNEIYEKSGAEADRFDHNEYFETKLKETYFNDYESNNKVHFSNSFELNEFYEEGVQIIEFIKKNRANYFSKKGWYLVGCEIPILINPNPKFENILFKGFLDVVLYNEITGKFKILDIKTSKKGWNAMVKKDEHKQAQLILYKVFFSKQFNVPIENIDVEFFIVKRQIWEEAEFAAAKRRVQEFRPASGKNKMKKATEAIDEFISTVFEEDGTHRIKQYEPNPSKFNCTFCPFNNRPELCSANKVF